MSKIKTLSKKELALLPFFLKKVTQMTKQQWIFTISFDWGLHKDIPPSIASKLLDKFIEEKLLYQHGDYVSYRPDISTVNQKKLEVYEWKM